MQFALIAAGRVNGSFIARLPRLDARLGPGVAQSYRLASRIVNTLGAGHPAKDYGPLARSRVVLICVLPVHVPALSEQLAASSFDWSGKLVLLCDSERNSSALAPLAAAGASVASLNPIPGLDGKWFVAEGDKRGVRQARRFVEELQAAAIEVDQEALASYEAGLSFASSLFTPVLEACRICLRDAGLTLRAANRLAEALFQQTLRAYVHAGRKSWSGPLARGDDAELATLAEALRRSNPVIAEYYCHSARSALRLLRRDPSSALE